MFCLVIKLTCLKFAKVITATIKKAARKIKEKSFLVINGDIITNIDLKKLLNDKEKERKIQDKNNIFINEKLNNNIAINNIETFEDLKKRAQTSTKSSKYINMLNELKDLGIVN